MLSCTWNVLMWIATLLWLPLALICDIVRLALVIGFGISHQDSFAPALIIGHVITFMAAASLYYGWAAAAAAAPLHSGDSMLPPLIVIRVEVHDTVGSSLRALAYGLYILISASIILLTQCTRFIARLFLVAPRLYSVSIVICTFAVRWSQ